MGNASSTSGQVGDGSHVPGDLDKFGEDSKRERRPEPSQILETDKSSTHSDSEKEVEDMEVPGPRLVYNLHTLHGCVRTTDVKNFLKQLLITAKFNDFIALALPFCCVLLITDNSSLDASLPASCTRD